MTKLKSAKRRVFLAVAAGVTAMLAPQVAAAGPTAGHTYRLTATVPVACWVRPTGTVMAESGRTGSVVEACNSPGGFTVSAQYRPLAETEKARIFYGDRSLNLAKSGMLELRLGRRQLHGELAEDLSVGMERVAGSGPVLVRKCGPRRGHR